VAYQGYGRGIPLETIRMLEHLLCQGVRPDLTLVLDIDPETGASRTGKRNQGVGQQATRFEKEDLKFFERVRTGYRNIAREEPQRVRLLNAKETIEQVQQAVRGCLEEVLGTGLSRGSHGI
jgi:dTMP kinase